MSQVRKQPPRTGKGFRTQASVGPVIILILMFVFLFFVFVWLFGFLFCVFLFGFVDRIVAVSEDCASSDKQRKARDPYSLSQKSNLLSIQKSFSASMLCLICIVSVLVGSKTRKRSARAYAYAEACICACAW